MKLYKKILDLKFRNKMCEILLSIIGVIFIIGTVYSNIILAYIATITFAMFILLLVFPFDKLNK